MNIEWLFEEQGFEPEEKGFDGMFFVGFRKNLQPPYATQRVGTVILKRSYSIDASSGVLTPLGEPDEPVPIYVTDRQDNLVRNSDFGITRDLLDPDFVGTPKPAFWKEDGLSADLEEPIKKEHTENPVCLSGTNPEGRLISDPPISFNQPLGGRCLQFSLSVRADIEDADIDSARIEPVHVKGESDSDKYLVCDGTDDTVVGNEFKRISAGEYFPAGLAVKELTIVLPIATNPDTGEAIPTYYNMVQLEERDYVSEWDPDYVLRCESDLVPYKPHSDIIVSGFARDAGTYRVVVQEDGYTQTVLERECRADEKALFGWEPRAMVDTVNSEVHLLYRGQSQDISFSCDTPPEWPATTPEKDPLPDGFDNAFFNGYLRVGQAPAYLSSGARISIMREDSTGNYSVIYAFSLAGERFDAAYYVLVGPDARDSEAFWQRHALEMNLDTLVIEPDNDTCYAVWRGVWDFDRHADGDYRKLEITLLDE